MREYAPTAEILKGLKEVHEQLLPLVTRLSELDEMAPPHLHHDTSLVFINADWAECSLAYTITRIEKEIK